MKQFIHSKFFILSVFVFCAIGDSAVAQINLVKIHPDSVINDVSNHPIGINLDFFMDGGRFPNPKRTVTEAMRDMGVKYLRYPGGEKSDLYLFSVPPYEKSVPTLARTAGLADYPGVITNNKTFTYDPLDFDEYMTMCRSINAEPVVVVAADCYLLNLKKGETLTSREGLIHNAVEWVKYANIKKKYGIRYWMVGNESWNNNNENSSADIYAQDVIDFSKAMKAVDPSILIIANGASEEFFKTVIQKAGDYIDRLCVSNYGVYDFYRGYQTYLDTTKVLIWPAMTAIEAMNKYATAEQQKRLKMIVAEYGTIDWAHLWKGTNDMGHAIVAFDMAGQLLLQPQIEFSCFWNTRWIENERKPGADHDALDKDGNFNPTGQALKIWGNFLGKQMVRAVATAPVISYSSYNPEENKLFIYLINKSEIPQKATISIDGYTGQSITQSWEYVGTSSDDINPVWKKRKKCTLRKIQTLDGSSITVFEVNLKR